MYYYLIFALQGFCVYHCYTNRNNYYWILAIIFLPVIGSLLYLFMNVIRKRDIEVVQEQLETVINPSKKIKDLEKRFKFSATFQNQVALADGYLEEAQYEAAITNYEAALKDVFAQDFYVLSKLQEAYYYKTDFQASVDTANRIVESPKFKKSRASFLYGMALEKLGKIDDAEKWLYSFDAPYNYYMERLELARFYARNNKKDLAKSVYEEMVNEAENMSKQSLRTNKLLIRKAKEELQLVH